MTLMNDNIEFNKSDRLKDQQFINQLQNEIGFMSTRLELFGENKPKSKQSEKSFADNKNSINVKK
jgi:hypothetical protein